MSPPPRLTAAEAVLLRTGPNCITILFEATESFDSGRALLGLHRMATGAERFQRPLAARRFGPVAAINWPRHVAVVEAPGIPANAVMDAMRRLHLPPGRPMWQAALINPEGGGWSGLALHFDHAIADGTRISRHITSRTVLGDAPGLRTDALPRQSFADLVARADPRLAPAGSALVRLDFAGLARAIPEAAGHSDALLRLGRRMLDSDPAFAGVAMRRRDHAAVARIEALRSADGVLGNRARMDHLDLSAAAHGARGLFEGGRAAGLERVRMALSRLVPAPVLKRIVEAEFSRPGIVLTVVPVARKLPALFGLELAAIHPAAPVLGRPPLAITAVRTGDGFDACITAHGPTGDAVPGLSQRVAVAMETAMR